MNKPNRLYIIGNGFDLQHDLQTKFKHFAEFLKVNNESLFEDIEEYMNIHSDVEWNEFENKMDFDLDQDIDLKKFIENISTEFLNFICAVVTTNLKERVTLNSNALFLTFNYTDTLDFYDIKRDNICYIHRNAKESKKAEGREDYKEEEHRLILGHHSNENYLLKKSQEENFDTTDYETMDEIGERYEEGQEFFKDTESIIKENASFFERIKDIDEVYVLGHSISDIDMDYFKKIHKQLRLKPHWFVTYHKEEDKSYFIGQLEEIGLTHQYYSLISWDDSKLH